jgi:tRNA threonylcarbamoyl adenosine modification protein YjeE
MQSLHLAGEDQTAQLAEAIARYLRAGDLVLLDGPLGAGKTTFVRALVAALGGDAQQVSSPTFTLLGHYRGLIDVLHVDAYRLDGPAGLLALGFAELSEHGVGVIEWADRVMSAAERAACWNVRLEHAGDGGRRATVQPPAEHAGKPLQLPIPD